jgi:tetratricopeptide (TPR) repeat protein
MAEAEAMYLRALRIAPNDSQATAQISKLYLAAGKPAVAVPYLQQLATRSDDPEALAELGNAYLLLGRFDSATVALNRALTTDPRNAAALRWMGTLFVEQGRGADAVPYLERAVAADPASAFAYAMLVSAYAQARRPADAEAAATAALSHAVTDASIRVLCARGLLAAGSVDGAERLLVEATRMDPRDPEAWTRLGMVQAQRGRRQEAVASVTRALAVSPDYPPAREVLRVLRQ